MKQLSFDEAQETRSFSRDNGGRFVRGPVPTAAEIATVERADGLVFPIGAYEYPNPSVIVRARSRGQGIAFYDVMEGTDSDLAAFSRDLVDDVLHYPYTIKPASTEARHVEHARFFDYALRSIPNRQNVIRHFLSSYMRGFSVTEKMFRVQSGGEWSGAVLFDRLLDRPQRWFTFDLDRNLRFRTAKNTMPGELVPAEKFIVLPFGSNSNPYGEALYDLVYWAWYLKHHALKNQAVFFEKWATPTAKAEYEWSSNEKLTKENRAKALRVLQSIQNDSSIAVPKGMIVGLIESMRNGTVSWESYIGQLTEMESRIVTGQILTSMGGDGGSHALGKVHEKRAANKVEMLAGFVSHAISRHIGRELIDRNYGEQDDYPTLTIIAQSPLSRQADAELEKLLISNGHKMSRAWSDEHFVIVPPQDATDILEFPVGLSPEQTLPVATGLAKPAAKPVAPIAFAAPPEHRALHADASMKAHETRRAHEQIGATAVKEAKPAIQKAVKGLAATLKGKKKANDATKATVVGGLQKTDVSTLGAVFEKMFRPGQAITAQLASGDEPPAISDDAKLALALQMLAIADRIHDAAKDAPETMTGAEAADKVTDPNALDLSSIFSNLFEGTHSTNIASIATGQLRKNLTSAEFRKRFPYVMIVVTNPNARLGHAMMDGFVMTAEEARFSPFLPPFDFGCDCKVVPISAERALAAGLTGGSPTGTIPEFLRGKGATPGVAGGYQTPDGRGFTAGPPPGFSPAYAGTDSAVQLSALRAKAEELRSEDPEAWASLANWLKWLFAFDILTEDPPPADEETTP